MNEAIAAVVFDLDGVLVDSESVWDAARREVVARNGGRWQADATRAMMGMSSPEWSRYLHDQLGVPLEPEQINELVVAALLDQYRRRLPLLPGAVEILGTNVKAFPGEMNEGLLAFNDVDGQLQHILGDLLVLTTSAALPTE